MRSCLIFLLLVCSVAHAQQQEPEIIRTNTELVQTAITVLDKKGHFVEGLQRDQFQLLVDGKPRHVAFFERVAAGSPREVEIANLGNPIPKTTTGAPRIPGINAPKNGGSDSIFYNHHTPLAPGIYQFRVVARDEKSGRVGSAIQWIVIPDLAKSQLTLSSVLLGGQVLEDKNNAHVQLSVDHTFPRMSQMGYWVFVYNAKRDAGGKPNITVQSQVLRDGQAVLTSQKKVSNTGPDPERIPFGEELALKTLAPGKYDLKVTVTDSISGTSTSQTADFTVK